MRFSVTLDDEAVNQIDKLAGEQGISRSSWVAQAATQALTQDDSSQVKALHELVGILKTHNDFLQVQVQQLTARIPLALPSPERASWWGRFKARLKGNQDEPGPVQT
jgi:metal-responsive CopG/Arc/MetJ family transcriptional regulator